MAFQITEADGLVRLNLFGTLTVEDLRSAAEALGILERKSGRVPDRLIDLTGIVQSTVTADNIREMARRRRGLSFPNSYQVAILVTSPARLGYARMYEIINDHPCITTRYFTDEAEAWAWLRSPLGDSKRELPSG